MNVNLHLEGELEKFINNLVNRGLAANKTEAIRLAITRYYEEQLKIKNQSEEEPLNQLAIEAHWNNPSDEKSSEFYTKRYLHGQKA
ncbi:MAG: hypothetical protein Q7S22_08240 [Candidatus Micrarchaeota archaeon]|nr:hypothetical protein [Candidatus Micrarchaeota archaeon]